MSRDCEENLKGLCDREEGCVRLAHPRHGTILQPGYQAHFSPLLLYAHLSKGCLQPCPEF